MVGMGYLRDADVKLDLATDDALGADWQQPFQVIAFDIEIDEGDEAGAVVADHPVRPASHARFVALDRELQRDDGAVFDLGDRRRVAAVDEAGRQVP